MPIRCANCEQDNRDGAKYCLRCGSRLDAVGGADPLIGAVIHGRFRIERVLGEGGMGRVYLAAQQMGTATRDVAIKVLHGTHSADPVLRKRFYRECEVVVRLTHPNTIQFYDFGELEDGRLFIVMEYIEGRSLSDTLRDGAMPLPLVERLTSQIAGSLQEAHDRGIVHRDLKPENILLTTRGGEPDFAKVCDFGIAKHEEHDEPDASLTLQGTVIGTPQYMSPEQLPGGDVDARSDLYSFGLILYEMIAGRRPFEARSPLEWASKHTTETPPPLDDVEAARDLPERVKNAVMHALAKLPEHRPQSARELAASLLGHELDTPVASPSARPPASTPAPRSEPPRGIDGTAPTLLASPAAMKAPTGGDVLQPAGVRSMMVPLAVAAVVGAALVVGGWYALRRGEGDGPAVATAPDAGAADAGLGDAGVDGGAGANEPTEWLRIVHFQRRIQSGALALGPPDGEHAVVRPQGTITLELAAGTRIETDGGPGPDVFIRIDDERSGPYRADVGVQRHRFTTVGSELVGSLPLDADQFGIRRIRYVRIKNRSDRNLYLDAVGVYRTVTIPFGRR